MRADQRALAARNTFRAARARGTSMLGLGRRRGSGIRFAALLAGEVRLNASPWPNYQVRVVVFGGTGGTALTAIRTQ